MVGVDKDSGGKKKKSMKCFLGILVCTQFQLYVQISPRTLRAVSPTKLLMFQHRWKSKEDKTSAVFHIHSSRLVEESQIRMCSFYVVSLGMKQNDVQQKYL